MKSNSHVWDYQHRLRLDVREMRHLVKGLPEESREVVLKNLKAAYPQLLIALTPHGDLQIEANK